MLVLNTELKRLFKEIRKAKRKRKWNDPLEEFTIVTHNQNNTGPRIIFIEGEAPASFWKSKQAENLTPRPIHSQRSERN